MLHNLDIAVYPSLTWFLQKCTGWVRFRLLFQCLTLFCLHGLLKWLIYWDCVHYVHLFNSSWFMISWNKSLCHSCNCLSSLVLEKDIRTYIINGYWIFVTYWDTHRLVLSILTCDLQHKNVQTKSWVFLDAKSSLYFFAKSYRSVC